jgi:hypothetical protein
MDLPHINSDQRGVELKTAQNAFVSTFNREMKGESVLSDIAFQFTVTE